LSASRYAAFAWLALSPIDSAAGPESAPQAQPAPGATPAPAACAAPEFRALDFWIGRWRVETPGGRHAGDSLIEPVLEGCALIERWTGIFLTTGRVQRGIGLHRYDAAAGQWRQAWVDDTGTTLDSLGRQHEGRIVYAERDPASGMPARVSLARLPDGRVEQIGERWDEATRGWHTAFHLIYLPER
jgi:hypothetical protein